ncbi:hypothetical protein AB0C90_40350 [Streptomyces sp. NPDC048550]|uniref:hypothetical protein n=1 Tax=Streptomyces sp. NPDC048550 TaxID=3155739 RepID=UPI003412EB95
MTRTSRTQRLALLTATTALLSGGGLLSSSAFAAPATPHSVPASTVTFHSDHGKGDWNNRKDKKRGGKTKVTTRETTRELEIRKDGTKILRVTTKETTKVTNKKGLHKSNNELQGPVNNGNGPVNGNTELQGPVNGNTEL